MLIFYGIYAFGNPDVARNDGNHCYATEFDTLTNTLPVAADVPGAIDVSAEMIGWFKGMFWLNIINLALESALLCVQMKLGVQKGWMAVSYCLKCVMLMFIIAIVIKGSKIRNSPAGKVCGGDYSAEGKIDPYMIASGKFMRFILIIMWISLSLMACALCLGIAAVAGFVKMGGLEQ